MIKFCICRNIVYLLCIFLIGIIGAISIQSPPIYDSAHIGARYLVNTGTCRIRKAPLFDAEIRRLYFPRHGQDYRCDQRPPFAVRRVNRTWIHLNRTSANSTEWICYANELIRCAKYDSAKKSATKLGPLSDWTNFANNQSATTTTVDDDDDNKDCDEDDDEDGDKDGDKSGKKPKWDAVVISCANDVTKKTYNRVVPLIQPIIFARSNNSHNNNNSNNNESSRNYTPNVNVILLGLDSVSRLNFLRQLPTVRLLLQTHGFIPLYGYHKVAKNTFVNLFPMLTGRLWSESEFVGEQKNFRFDNVSMIFEDFGRRHGYRTAFVEDMASFAIFHTSDYLGFLRPPMDYYLRAENIEIWKEIYSDNSCYQEMPEDVHYWHWILDLWRSYEEDEKKQKSKSKSKSRPLRHFTFAHMSTITHNIFNNAGYADRPYSRFLRSLFDAGYHRDSLIILYSDHAIRFGSILNTTSAIHESRLPFIYIHVPDQMRIGKLRAEQIRAALRINRHRLTSHIDIYATLRHLADGDTRYTDGRANSGNSTFPIFGRSLFVPVPRNRTCAAAGIAESYCMCNGYRRVPISDDVLSDTNRAIKYINHLLEPHPCVPLRSYKTYRALDAYDRAARQRLRLIHFLVKPSNAVFEAIIRIPDKRSDRTDDNNNNGADAELDDKSVIHISRINRYDDQSRCVRTNQTVLEFCYCNK